MILATSMSSAIRKIANQNGKKTLLFWTTLMGYSFEVIFNRAIMALFYQDSRSNASVIIQNPKKRWTQRVLPLLKGLIQYLLTVLPTLTMKNDVQVCQMSVVLLPIDEHVQVRSMFKK